LLLFSPESFVFLSHIKNLKIKIYRTVILPVVLYGCETLSLTLGKEQRLRVFVNRGYLDLKGMKKDRGENCMMMNIIACNLLLILLG
jgi:hypothetical protein